MSINLAAKASSKVVERFKLKSMTEGLYTAKYDWTGVATVRVYTTDLLTLNDYDREEVSGPRFGTLEEVGDTVQEMTVNDDKSFNGAIDKGNNTSQLQIKAASRILRENTDNVLIPYVDKYRLSAMATNAGIKEYNKSLAKNTVLETLMTSGAAMSNQLVPTDGRVLYIGQTEAIKMKLADQVVGVDHLAEKVIVNGVIGAIDGMQVRIVPDSYMPTNAVYMIVKKGCCVAPVKVETYRILDEHPDIDGHVVQARFLHDCFVLETLAKGVLVAYSTAAPSV